MGSFIFPSCIVQPIHANFQDSSTEKEVKKDGPMKNQTFSERDSKDTIWE